MTTVTDTTKLKTINPARESTLNEYNIMTRDQINATVKTSRSAFSEWKKDVDKRAHLLYDFANEFRKNKENLARIVTQEMGKAIKESRLEVEKCAWAIEYFADNGKILTSDEVVNTDARKSIITFQPIGVIGSIMPWNFPYWQALRFAAPSLMVGNTIVLKPASATMQCGIEIEKTFRKAGIADGVFQTLIGDSRIAETLIDSDINAVTFTGSVPVGAKVAQRATSQLKKTVLELDKEHGFNNVEFRKGDIENSIPVEDHSVDAVISNCVINLTMDKVKTFKEVYRILKKNGKGRMVISDLVTSKEIHGESISTENWCSCIDGALTRENSINSMKEAGFKDVRVLSKQLYMEEVNTDGRKITSLVIGAVTGS